MSKDKFNNTQKTNSGTKPSAPTKANSEIRNSSKGGKLPPIETRGSKGKK